MTKSQILLSVAAILVIAVMFKLPNVVVDNETAPIEEENPADLDAPIDLSAVALGLKAPSFSSEQVARITRLREKFSAAKNPEKSAIFADSLAESFLESNSFDSAAKYLELAVINNPDPALQRKAGDFYYKVFQLAQGQDKIRLGQQVRSYMEKVLEREMTTEERLEIKNKVAMTWVSSDNPMQGILMLRKILEEDQENEQAIFNLGVLSLQSGQIDRAIKRFEELIARYPANMHGQLMLGISYMENGNKEQARRQFLTVLDNSSDAAMIEMAGTYLKEIN